MKIESKWKSVKRVLTIGALVTVLGAALTGCGSSEKTQGAKTTTKSTAEDTSSSKEEKVVRISGPGVDSKGTVTLPGSAQLAQKQQFFDEELKKAGYKVEYSGFQNGGVGVNEALASKETDIAIYGDFPAVTYIANGNDAKIFAVSTSKNQMGIFAKKEIKSVADLKGKKVCTMLGTNAYYYLQKELEENGLSIKDVQVVNASTDAATLYTSGEVDALCNGPQVYWALEAKGLGQEIATSGNSDSLSTSHVVLGRTEFLEENPDVEGAIIKALEKAQEWANANEDEVYKTLSDVSGGIFTEENYKKYYSFEEKFDDMTPYIQEKDITHLQDVADFMEKNKYIKSAVDVSKSIDDSIQKK